MGSGEKQAENGISLEEARQEIDRLDDLIADSLAKRFAVTAKVKQAKKNEPTLWQSPLRPTREASILRRLLARIKGSDVSPELVLRVWRSILSDSSQRQAAITLHISRHLNANMAHRLRLRDYFGTMPVEEYRDEAQALIQIDTSPTDLCVVETDQPWVEAFIAGHAGKAKVIAALPVWKEEEAPKLLVIGQAPLEASGDDETLVISEGKLPRDFSPQPLWQLKIGAHRLSCLPGFLTEHESPLLGLMRSNAALKLKVAGHYSSPIEKEG